MFKKYFLFFILILFLVTLTSKYITWGEISTKEIDENYIEIKRKRYPFRHWRWSGIPPFYGWFIPDPHFAESAPTKLPADILKFLGVKEGRYQLYDVNPYFEPENVENLMVFEIDGKLYTYQVKLPLKSEIVTLSEEPADVEFIIFAKNEIVGFMKYNDYCVEEVFMTGLFFLKLPFENGSHLEFYNSKSKTYKQISNQLKK